MLTQATFDFIDEVDRLRDQAALVASFQKVVSGFGITYFMVGEPKPPATPLTENDGHIWGTTWPSEWLSRWTTRNYLQVDPVVRHIRTHNRPLRWSALEGASDDPGKRVMLEAGEFRMHGGYTVPIYSRDGLAVAVSLGSEHYELGKREEACLHMASIYMHATLERLRGRYARPRGPKLTNRERECLSWVAAGKTDWEISQILKIA